MLCAPSRQTACRKTPAPLRLAAARRRSENARPGNGDPQAVKAHLGEQGDIFRVAMIKIDRDIFDAAVARTRSTTGPKTPCG
jgi:hypothetical protein